MQTLELVRVHSEENLKLIFYIHNLRITELFNTSLHRKEVSIKCHNMREEMNHHEENKQVQQPEKVVTWMLHPHAVH